MGKNEEIVAEQVEETEAQDVEDDTPNPFGDYDYDDTDASDDEAADDDGVEPEASESTGEDRDRSERRERRVHVADEYLRRVATTDRQRRRRHGRAAAETVPVAEPAGHHGADRQP